MVRGAAVQVLNLRSALSLLNLLSARKICGLILIDHQFPFSPRRFKVLKIPVENRVCDFKRGIGIAAQRSQTQTAAQTFRTGLEIN